MNNSFFEKSKDIANDFIQSIVFLDDKAYEAIGDNSDHNFDAQQITQAFAIEKKICAVYNPKSYSDIDNFIPIAINADIVVLDWQIIITQQIEKGLEEEDALEDDPRGMYTKKIIKAILIDDKESRNDLKVLIIYTGDYTILEEIVQEIYDDVFNDSENYTLDSDNYSIQSSRIKLLVRAKKTEIKTESNKEKYENFMLSYSELPKFILVEFTKITSGLLSNFALMSLTALRKNSSKILGVFTRDMDSAYLGHKVSIPKQQNAEDLLIELMGDSIKDLLYYTNIGKNLNDLIDTWIEQQIQEKSYSIKDRQFLRTKVLVKGVLHSESDEIDDRLNISNLSKNGKDELKNNITTLFMESYDINEAEKKDIAFAKLTHHKSIFIPTNATPVLSLGTLVKSDKSATYYVCIQQKCDSVRIKKNTDRKFLFIPLTISTNAKFDLLTPDGLKLIRDKKSYAIRTIRFKCIDDSGSIIATKHGNKFIFRQIYTNPESESFEWVLDLKDLHSQRIIIEYTSQLSRVGLNESEWHRKKMN